MCAAVRRYIQDLALGDRIRQMREHQGLSLQELSERTGLAKGLLSQIEKEQVSPPISTLLKIAASLETDISLLFQEEQEAPESGKTTVIRKDERIISQRRQVQGKAKLGYTYEALAFKKAFKQMEPFLVSFDPKQEEEVLRFSHSGEEFAFVLEGKLEFSTDKETIVLEPGDSLYFESDQLHGFRALDQEPAQALVVVHHT
ncbi:MAG: helix-turn-helix domain-containing protein [Desulfohalobiaceae bacterium]